MEKVIFSKGDKIKIASHHYWQAQKTDDEYFYGEVVVGEENSAGQIYASISNNSPQYLFAKHYVKISDKEFNEHFGGEL